MNVPDGLYYTEEHEWIKVTDGKARVGITDFAQSELTDIVFVELPEGGKNVAKGEACCVVESVKTASDIYAPVSGKITDVNEKISEEPELINEDPYGQGWLFEMEVDDTSELDTLLSSQDYKKQLGE